MLNDKNRPPEEFTSAKFINFDENLKIARRVKNVDMRAHVALQQIINGIF